MTTMKTLHRLVPKVGDVSNTSKSSYIHKFGETIALIALLSVFQIQFLSCAASSDKESGSGSAESNDNAALIVDLENVVGYGEDCSSEGPFCNPMQNLACDLEEEICYCDAKNGYVHVGNLESELTLFNYITDDEAGEHKGKKVCMKSSELEEKLDKLMNITKKIKNIGGILMKYQKYLPKKYQDMLKLKDEIFGNKKLRDNKFCKLTSQLTTTGYGYGWT
ncbi:hypothetical protein Ocin01_01331 [Orchesella cincta]|uniref:Uncharacterized protein n=1 Tax=Orchesella cincta TaxID=48709 RepID=A0A1D2NJD0_ORCCI|nr:hypothetical protein Ocin01_01331 [Orchesella cincta]